MLSGLPPRAKLSSAEWDELQALRRAISWNPASVHYAKMELFAELFSRSLIGKGDQICYTDPKRKSTYD
jgi:hypothetical protein